MEFLVPWIFVILLFVVVMYVGAISALRNLKDVRVYRPVREQLAWWKDETRGLVNRYLAGNEEGGL
jgi:hypothetical protein